MGRARLSSPPPKSGYHGVGDPEGDWAQQQLPELEESREAGGHSGNTLPRPGRDHINRNTVGKKKPSPRSGTCWGPSTALSTVYASFDLMLHPL